MQVLGDICEIELVECSKLPDAEVSYWICNTCTFSENNLEETNCVMCGSENGIRNKNNWICKACTFENIGCDSKCSVCDNLNQ